MSNGEYEAKVTRNAIVGTYRATVLLDGEVIGDAPALGLGAVTREGALKAARHLATVHRENAGPPVKLGVSPRAAPDAAAALSEGQKRLLEYFTGPQAGSYQRPRLRQGLAEAKDTGDWHGELRLLLDQLDAEENDDA